MHQPCSHALPLALRSSSRPSLLPRFLFRRRQSDVWGYFRRVAMHRDKSSTIPLERLALLRLSNLVGLWIQSSLSSVEVAERTSNLVDCYVMVTFSI